MDDRQGKPGRDGRVDGIASLAHDLDSRVRGEVVDAHDHRVLGAGGLLLEVSRRSEVDRAEAMVGTAVTAANSNDIFAWANLVGIVARILSCFPYKTAWFL